MPRPSIFFSAASCPHRLESAKINFSQSRSINTKPWPAAWHLQLFDLPQGLSLSLSLSSVHAHAFCTHAARTAWFSQPESISLLRPTSVIKQTRPSCRPSDAAKHAVFTIKQSQDVSSTNRHERPFILFGNLRRSPETCEDSRPPTPFDAGDIVRPSRRLPVSNALRAEGRIYSPAPFSSHPVGAPACGQAFAVR
jgi:hypothetical protein